MFVLGIVNVLLFFIEQLLEHAIQGLNAYAFGNYLLTLVEHVYYRCRVDVEQVTEVRAERGVPNINPGQLVLADVVNPFG
jgi:hypothetical protein